MQTLRAASQVEREAVTFSAGPGSSTFETTVAPHSVNLIEVDEEAAA